MDEVDRYGVSKKKKLKLKNLRTVCNKILDFCDRTEAEDMFYEQVGMLIHSQHILFQMFKGISYAWLNRRKQLPT